MIIESTRTDEMNPQIVSIQFSWIMALMKKLHMWPELVFKLDEWVFLIRFITLGRLKYVF